MAKEKEKKAATDQKDEQQTGDFRVNNLMSDEAVVGAVEKIKKEKDEKKVRDAMEAICKATYNNAKTRIALRQRRREDDITKEKLDATKSLLERLLGVKTEIKDGVLVPTKEKIPEDQKLTPTEYDSEKDKLNEEIAKKIRESNTVYDNEIRELRSSYEGRYRSWWD